MFGLLLFALAIIPSPTNVHCNGGEVPGTSFAPFDVAINQVVDKSVECEGYVLQIEPTGVTIRSSDESGAFYARKTLEQIVDWRGYPCMTISDSPAYHWRGMLFDDARHFFGKNTLKKTLDLMSQYKLNVLHWHLVDDQGWRLDIPGLPELVRYGAVRVASPKHGASVRWIDKANEKYTFDLDGEKCGPFFYTEADVREIVDYAKQRHIKVVPEIEFPGHVYAMLAAHPELACVPENLSARSPRLIWGIEKDVLCLGNDESIRIMERCLIMYAAYSHLMSFTSGGMSAHRTGGGRALNAKREFGKRV